MEEIPYDPESVWYVDEETWDWLQALLAEEPKEIPKLKELLTKPTIFDKENEDG